MDLSIYDGLKAAFGFRLEDLHASVSDRISAAMTDLATTEAYLESDEGGRHHLFIEATGGTFPILAFDPASPSDIVIDFGEAKLKVMILSDQEYQNGINPKDGLITDIIIAPTKLKFRIGLVERSFGRIDYTESDLQSEQLLDAKDLIAKSAVRKSTALGASTNSTLTIELLNSADGLTPTWLEKTFPGFRQAISDNLLADIVLIHDVRTEICRNVVLSPDKAVQVIETSYQPDMGMGYPLLVIGSEEADLLAPDCPTYFSKAVLDLSSEEVKAGTKVTSNTADTGEVAIPDLKVSSKSLLGQDYLATANNALSIEEKRFHLWMSKELLSKTFNYRISKNIGLLLAAHYDDKWGIVKWWMSGGWVLKKIEGDLNINRTSASIEVDFGGRTKFDAMGYVDLNCFQVEIGSLDAFHEKFDFTLFSELLLSWKDGKVVFSAGFKNVRFSKWRSFLRFILDKYVKSWKYVVARLVVDFIFSKVLKAFVEDEITDAMGSLSIDLLDLSDIPVVGNFFKSMLSDSDSGSDSDSDSTPWPRASGSSSANDHGIEFIAGVAAG